MEHHEDFSQNSIARELPAIGLQHGDGLLRWQYKGRVAAGNQTHRCDDCQKPDEEWGIQQEHDRKFFICKITECRRHRKGECGGQHRSGQRDEHRLCDELQNEIAPEGSHYFSHTYFFEPFSRPGRGEVDEINARHQQDRQSDDGKNV